MCIWVLFSNLFRTLTSIWFISSYICTLCNSANYFLSYFEFVITLLFDKVSQDAVHASRYVIITSGNISKH